MGSSSAKPQQNSSRITHVILNYQTSTVEAVRKGDGTLIKEGDEIEQQKHIIQQAGGIDSFVERNYSSGLNDLVAQAICVQEHLRECFYIRGELSRIITTHVVEIVRSVHLFIYFLEKGNTLRSGHCSEIVFSEIKQMKAKLKEIQLHLQKRSEEHNVSSYLKSLLSDLKFGICSLLGKDAKFRHYKIQYIIKKMTAEAHLRCQLRKANDKVDKVLCSTSRVESAVRSIHANATAKILYLHNLKEHNRLLENLLRAENYEVTCVEKIIKEIEDADKAMYEEALETAKNEYDEANTPMYHSGRSYDIFNGGFDSRCGTSSAYLAVRSGRVCFAGQLGLSLQ